MAANPKIIVIGGGLAGLSAAIKIAEMGGQVELFSIVPVKRSHSVCAQGGINAAKNLKGEGDSTWQHLDDTVYGGDFLGNQLPRDVATRAIFKVVYEHNLGVDGQPMVYLDLTHIDRATLDRKLEGILEIYEKFVGDDPRTTPMKIFPGMHYTMGGLWVDFNQMTNIPGLFAAGECEYQYHGANRLGANSLVSCIFGGFTVGPNALAYAKGLTK